MSLHSSPDFGENSVPGPANPNDGAPAQGAGAVQVVTLCTCPNRIGKLVDPASVLTTSGISSPLRSSAGRRTVSSPNPGPAATEKAGMPSTVTLTGGQVRLVPERITLEQGSAPPSVDRRPRMAFNSGGPGQSFGPMRSRGGVASTGAC